MKSSEYGTPEFYAELFSDILSDVDAEYAPNATENIYRGFLLAIDSWLDYHRSQAAAYANFKEKVRKSLGMMV
tara:strand:- start:287 stop:505 length:219 start_codon:yes stop_codon:yes gene_type:complete